MNTKKPVVSPCFAALFDLYRSELEQMGRDGQGEESQQALLDEIQKRRDQPALYMQLAKEHPEFSAVMFYGAFEFNNKSNSPAIEKLVTLSSMQFIATPEQILNEISLTTNAHTVVNLVSNMASGGRLIAIAIGLEYLRSVGWTPDEVLVEAEGPDDDDDNEGVWSVDQAPQVIGLDERV